MSRTAHVALIFPPPFSAAVAYGAYASVPALAAFLRAHGLRVSVIDLNRRFLTRVLEKMRGLSPKSDNPFVLAIRFIQRRSQLEALDKKLVDMLVAVAQYEGLLHIVTVSELLAHPTQNPFLDFASAVLEEELLEPVELAAISLASFEQLPAALAAAGCIKSRGLANFVMIGGPAVALAPPTFLRRLLRETSLDGAGIGLGEELLLEIAQVAAAGLDIPPIAGLITRSKHSAPAPSPKNLDHLPVPDFSDVPAAVWSAPDTAPPIRFAAGCTWGRCTFCDSRQTSPGARFRSPALVASDLETVGRRHRVRHFHLIGDTLPPLYAKRLADEIRTRRLDVGWWCYMRIDPAFDRELLAELAQAGCEQVTLGVESTHPQILKAMDKGYGPESINPMIDDLLACGISIKVNLIFDFPGQTFDQALHDFRFAEQIIEHVDHLAAFPFVLSQWSRIAEKPEAYDLELLETGESGEGRVIHKAGPHLLGFRRHRGMTREQAATMAALYGSLRLRDSRCRALCRTLDNPELDWASRRYAVRRQDVEICPATRRVFNAVQQRTHQLNASGWPLLERLLSPGGAAFDELCRTAVAAGSSPTCYRNELASFLTDLARTGLLREA